MATVFKKEVVDPSTGEVIQAVAFIPEHKDKGFVKVYKLFGERVLRDLANLDRAGNLIIWFIAKTLELPTQSDLWIPIDYEELAKDLGVSKRSIMSYIKKLLELGYIEQFKPRHSTFRMKPDYLYKGILSKYQNDQLEVLINKASTR